jgi:hypothetical protein
MPIPLNSKDIRIGSPFFSLLCPSSVISGAREKWTQTNAEEVQITAQENTRFSHFTLKQIEPDTEIGMCTAPKPRWNYRTSGQRPSKSTK